MKIFQTIPQLAFLFITTINALAIPSDLHLRDDAHLNSGLNLQLYRSKDCADPTSSSKRIPYGIKIKSDKNFLAIKANRLLQGSEKLHLFTNGKDGQPKAVGTFTANGVEWQEGKRKGNRASDAFYDGVCANVYESTSFVLEQ